jgi:hypothetical protein
MASGTSAWPTLGLATIRTEPVPRSPQFLGELVDPDHALMDLIDLLEQAARLRRRLDATAHALEQAQRQPILGIGQQAADRWLRDREQAGRTADRAGDHDGPEDFDLPEIEAHDDNIRYGRPHNKHDSFRA